MASSSAAAASSDAWREGISDETILAQSEQIKREIEAAQPLIGTVEEPSVLLEEYKENPSFNKKIQSFCRQYKGLRRSRGDGNCFYRSFLASLGEAFVNAGVKPVGTAAGGAASPLQEAYERVCKHIKDSLETLCGAFGYPDSTTPDFHEALVDYFAGFSKEGASAEEAVLAPLQDKMSGLYLITYLRCLCSLELLSKEDDYLPYVLGVSNSATVRMFCDHEVEAVNTDADQLQIIALCGAFGVKVRIAYIDASAGEEVQIIEFPEQTASASATGSAGEAAAAAPAGEIVLDLLYRPGHYDMAYKA